MQSFMLTEVRNCDLLIVVTSSPYLKRKDILNSRSIAGEPFDLVGSPQKAFVLRTMRMRFC